MKKPPASLITPKTKIPERSKLFTEIRDNWSDMDCKERALKLRYLLQVTLDHHGGRYTFLDNAKNILKQSRDAIVKALKTHVDPSTARKWPRLKSTLDLEKLFPSRKKPESAPKKTRPEKIELNEKDTYEIDERAPQADLCEGIWGDELYYVSLTETLRRIHHPNPDQVLVRVEGKFGLCRVYRHLLKVKRVNP